MEGISVNSYEVDANAVAEASVARLLAGRAVPKKH